MNKFIIPSAAAALLALGMLSCSKEQIAPPAGPVDPESEETTETTQDLSRILSGLELPDHLLRADTPLPPPAPVIPGEDEELVETTLNDIPGIMLNHRKVYSAYAFDEFSVYNPYASQIYPGAVFVGNTIASGDYLPLPCKTIPIVWTANGLTPSDGMSYRAEVVSPKSSDYFTTLQQWFSAPHQPLSSTTVYDLNEVEQSKDLETKLGVGFNKNDILAELNLTGRHQSMKTHILVKAVQKAFSVTMDIPTGLLVTELDQSALKGALPVYVSEVFYGRTAYAIVSSNHEYDEVIAALNINLSNEAEGDSEHVEISTKYKEILDSAVTKVYVSGGSNGSQSNGVNGWEGLKKALSEPLTASTAQPVAYTLRFLDKNDVARVVPMGEFVRNDAYFIPELSELKLQLQPIKARAKANSVRPLFLYGKVTATLEGKAPVTLFEHSMKDYIRIDDPEQEISLESDPSTSVSIPRPTGMSMREFLESYITIDAEFGHTNAAGSARIFDLGNTSVKMKVSDLIVKMMQGSLNVYTQARRGGTFEANVVFEVGVDNEIRHLSHSEK